MDITLNALRYLVEVARTRSISKAARNFYFSQPHMSNIIRSVEQEVGMPLFYRSSKGMELTETGKKFVLQAQKILKETDALEEAFSSSPDQCVRLSISMTRSYQVLRVITGFINDNDGKERFDVAVRETNPFQVIEDVRSGLSQLGVLHFYDTQEQYFFHCIAAAGLVYTSNYKRKFLLAMSTDSPLARVAAIDSPMLLDKIMLAYGDYESPVAPYRFSGSEPYISSRRISVYERSTMMEILGRCPNTYALVTGLHPHTLSQYGLILRDCTDLELYNIGCTVYQEHTELTPLMKSVQEKIRSIDWTERVSDHF
ncbi:MAG: LysR family transcriptional regulator [Oscillospiraceae bacterium]|nr:LysR family transcriptional regulator [Oscillospiraceae bacterium]